MRLKDEHFHKRAFILSSFSRLKINLDSNVYRFADKLINENWTSSLKNLDEVDEEIKIKYYDFLRNG